MLYSKWNEVLLCGFVVAAVQATVIEQRAARADPSWTWKDWTCPLPTTVSLSFTEYVPVTTTQVQTATTSVFETETTYVTQSTTIYQTIISTEIITTVETAVLTTPTTVTVVTTSPLTLTATELEEIFTTTVRATSLTICPTRIQNPTFTLAAPLPTDWTWGCPPGWLCKPKQVGCNWEAGLPDQNFYCAPNECIPVEALPSTLPTWDTTIYGNDSAATNPALTVNAIDSFFNMNPTDFGLTYEIFVVNEVYTYTSTILLPPATPTMAARQAQTSVPAICYPWCNNCLLEAQSDGKTPALCQPGSAFEVALTSCEECINVHRTDNSGSFVQIAPQFQQFLDYCATYSTAIISTVMSQTITSGKSTFTTVVPTTMATIVPTASASLYSTILSTPILKTSVSTATIVAPPSSASLATPSSPSQTPVEATSIALSSSLASSPSSAASVAASSTPSASVYTYTSSVVATSTISAITYSGTQVTSITIIMTIGSNSTTLSGSTLSGYTIIIPTTTEVTTSYVTTVKTTGVAASTSPGSTIHSSSLAATTSVSGSGSGSSSTPAAPSASSFSGNAAAAPIAPSRETQTFLSAVLGWLMIFLI